LVSVQGGEGWEPEPSSADKGRVIHCLLTKGRGRGAQLKTEGEIRQEMEASGIKKIRKKRQKAREDLKKKGVLVGENRIFKTKKKKKRVNQKTVTPVRVDGGLKKKCWGQKKPQYRDTETKTTDEGGQGLSRCTKKRG